MRSGRGRCPFCPDSPYRLLREDFLHAGHPLRHVAELMILDPISLLLLYRLSHAAYWSPLRPVAWLLRSLEIVVFGSEIHPRACLGRRLHIAHVNGLLIGKGVVTGDDLKLFARVTIGGGRGGTWPTVGDSVTLFTGACLAGPARIGDGARLGPNVFFDGDLDEGETAFAPAAVVRPRRRSSAR